ncbi:hypothetical protein MFLAVUS_007718 [Mucor flavus]|uniref:alpha-L-fucosidase n=1 Tax=Mucor flavus TaxID=439312 RepID=A0ABP9Z539_9FUNG
MIYLYLILLVQYTLAVQYTFDTSNDSFINLRNHLNNKGTSGPRSNFDGTGSYFMCDNNKEDITVGTINYQLTATSQTKFDNVVSLGQIIPLPAHHVGGMYLLGAVNHGPLTADLVIVYADGSQTVTTLNIPDWQVKHTDQITRLDIHSCPLNTGYHGHLFSVPLLVNPALPLSHLLLPYTNPIGSFLPSLHIFSIATLPPVADLKVVAAKGTREWVSESKPYQIITVIVQNTSPAWISDAYVSVTASLLKTKYRGHIKRLAPGHHVTVQVAVSTIQKKRESRRVSVVVEDAEGTSMCEPTVMEQVEIGLEDYKDTPESLGKHTVPSWFQSARFGIFIHWGVYSMPSWAPVGSEYAEWYWWNYNRKYSSTYYYHRSFYGPDIEYDDFIRIWTPTQFDPNVWLNLVESSGAKYFVFTAKHHDGISLFNTKVNDRSSVKMNPYRDFVKELLDTAKESFPDLKRGIYCNYHDSSINWNGPPTNPYTGRQTKYTGAPAVNSFVNDVQVPQILELIQDYSPDIMWCDIGGINNSTAWQSKFLNTAKQSGQQVVMNDRCGNSVSDFATVEYQGINHVPERFYESTRGIDPHSFGFNHQTKPDQYATTSSLLRELVSTISKGGNFLLNIGPEGTGAIPQVMVDRLLEIGQWIEQNHEAVFDTVPYWVTSSDFHELRQPLHFMQSKDGKSFYVFSLEKPVGQRLVIKSTVPLHPDAKISLLSKSEALNWRVFSNGRLIVDVPDHVVEMEKALWVFKIEAP